MTAHTVPLLGAGTPAFLTAGDVYRRDTIDATHYPAFHQMDGVRLFPARAVPPAAAFAHLRLVLLSTARALFGPAARLRWVVADFPFTSPSVELEVWWAGEWLELLGAGLLTPRVLAAAGWEAAEVGSALDDAVAAAATGEVPPPAATPGGSSSADAAVAAAVRGPVVRGEPVVGWAFGLGLDRLAMVLHGIPDIRLLWSRDERVCEVVRATAGDVAEAVTRVGEPYTRDGRTSLCYRVTYRSMDRSLTHAEVDALQARVREGVVAAMGVRLR
ncbi:hypothetical protein I4F81_007413 [Pyropia yezoensis]|uniref:Uncharacterized protein n=1 Tax=Pyropia yezoensis TaxID=2788 RepID=A0ACC3C3Z6_PYRYE|nr:hypothetical protein I4F81_007413 [Neopyropia yezoensis]